VRTNKDLYEVLELPREASQDDIQQAHRKLIRKHHPDANPGDPSAEERFKEIQQAYELLSNPEKRQEYDKRFHTSSRGNSGRPRVGATGGRTRGSTTYTSPEKASRSRGPLFSLGYLLGIALIALVLVLLVMLVLGLD
jgi:curved DNA-binding protein CbpA